MALKATTGARLAAHPLTRDRLDIPIDELLDENDVVDTDAGFWRVIHTPGHATGHLCLFNGGLSTLVAGDMVAGVGTILLDPPEGNLHDYLESLSRLEALNPSRLLPAHGPALRTGPRCSDNASSIAACGQLRSEVLATTRLKLRPSRTASTERWYHS